MIYTINSTRYVSNTLEKNMERNPREDHRTVIVHFAVSESRAELPQGLGHFLERRLRHVIIVVVILNVV